MFGIGSRDPQLVAKRQLNQAELDLLEVAGALEGFQAQKRTLEDRIARLRSYTTAHEPVAQEESVVTKLRRERGLADVK